MRRWPPARRRRRCGVRPPASRLQLFALAYNLTDFLRGLALPDRIGQWSLATLRERLVMIGARIIRHGRHAIFQLAEVGVPRALFAAILRGATVCADRPLRRPDASGPWGGKSESRGENVRRDRPEVPRQPGSALGPGFSSSPRPRLAGGHVLKLTGDRPRSRISGVDRAHPGNIG
jgi:Transposase DDE domain group 1